ncbi:hypothetical protein MSAN_00547600 [Mycena sanguinolenta]|uniref:VHS domain-containing protein n=1 Tax=Mycena sanguinolenta TaxID=230812 RepID=A0A8H6Z6C5_9AGAR|nr:hypothetical protein MSAN_00547600 [Mycena sanguinolenta]
MSDGPEHALELGAQDPTPRLATDLVQNVVSPIASDSQQNTGTVTRRRDTEEQHELTRKIGFLTATASDDWTLILDICDSAFATDSNAKVAARALRREFKYGEPNTQLAAGAYVWSSSLSVAFLTFIKLWAIMLRNSSDVFIRWCTSRKFLDTLEDLLISPCTSPAVRERVMDILAAAAYASGPKKEAGFRGLWRRVKPHDKPEEGLPFDTDAALFDFEPPLVSAYDHDITNALREHAELQAAREHRERRRRAREREYEENELTRKIGYLTATASDDWVLILDVCEHASAMDAYAKDAVRALRREFRYGEPSAQLAAARLWAIMLNNCSDVFVDRCTSRKFLDAVGNLLTSSDTSLIVRERVMEVLAAAAYASGSDKNTAFRDLWCRVKPQDKPEDGVPFDNEDHWMNHPPPFTSACDSQANGINAPAAPIATDRDTTTIVGDTVPGRKPCSHGEIDFDDDESLVRQMEEERELPKYINTGKESVPSSPPASIELPKYVDVEPEDCPDTPTKVGNSPPAYTPMSAPQNQPRHSARRRVWKWPAISLVRFTALVQRLLGLRSRSQSGPVMFDKEK